jgi:RHS repeat-associated protein
MEKNFDAINNVDGNSYTTEFRQYDPRLGRWLSLDPLASSFPWQSPYCAFDNNPVLLVDPSGLAATNGSDPPKMTSDIKEGTLSKDGNWIAMMSDETGKMIWATSGVGSIGIIEITAKRTHTKEYSEKLRMAMLRCRNYLNGIAQHVAHPVQAAKRRQKQEADYNNSHSMMGQFMTGGNYNVKSGIGAGNAPKYGIGEMCEDIFVYGSCGVVAIFTGGLALQAAAPAGAEFLGFMNTTSYYTLGTSEAAAMTGWQYAAAVLGVGGSGSVVTYLGTSLLKSSIDAALQGTLKGVDKIDWGDAVASGLLAPAPSAIFGGAVDIQSSGVSVIGIDKNPALALTDMGLKYTFGSRGLVGKQVNKIPSLMTKNGVPQLAPVVNAPFSMGGKLAQDKIKNKLGF